MPSSTSPDSDRRPRDEELDEGERVWREPGSDDLMDTSVLARVVREGHEAELERQRKIERRGE